MPRKTRGEIRTQRNRNLYALHCAVRRLAGIAGQDVTEFKADWLRGRFNVEHSTDLSDTQLWEALDDANGKRPIFRDLPVVARDHGQDARATRREYGREHKPWGGRGDPGEAITTAQIRKIYSLAKERYGDRRMGEAGYVQRLQGFVMRQTRRTNKVESLTVREGQSIIGAFLGQRVKSGLRAAEEGGTTEGTEHTEEGGENTGMILTLAREAGQFNA